MARILVIDDDAQLLGLVEMVLRRHDFEVLSASSGIEGISIAETEQPDLILLDVLMPTFGGVKILRHLRSQEVTAHIPVIVVTAAQGEVIDKIKSMEEGPDLLMTKPFKPGDLVSNIRAVLDESA